MSSRPLDPSHKRKSSGDLQIGLMEIEKLVGAESLDSVPKTEPLNSNPTAPKQSIRQERSPRRAVNTDSALEAMGFVGSHNQSIVGEHFIIEQGEMDTSLDSNRESVNREGCEIQDGSKSAPAEEGKDDSTSSSIGLDEADVKKEASADTEMDGSDEKEAGAEIQDGSKSAPVEEGKDELPSFFTSNLSNCSNSVCDTSVGYRQEGHESMTSVVSAFGSSTDGLSVAENLSSMDNMVLKELLDSSNSETQLRKKKKHRSKSSIDLAHSKDHSKNHKKKFHRSRSNEDSIPSSRRRRSTHKLHRSAENAASSFSSTSSMAAVPREVYKGVFSRIRGGKPLKREGLVSSIVSRLCTGFNRNSDKIHCVALVPSDANCTEGIGKTTLAGLVCSRKDVRTYYHKGIAWVDLKQKKSIDKPKSSLDFGRYAAALFSILTQLGISAHHLELSPFAKTPCEDAFLADIRMKVQMEEARSAMSEILSTSRYFPKKKKSDGDRRNILVIIDNIENEMDLEWFTFRHRGKNEVINDILVTSTQVIDKSVSISIPPLTEEDSIKLILMEANLQRNHKVSDAVELKDIVRKSQFHPLTIKFLGRWLNLKRMTDNKRYDEILTEIKHSFLDAPTSVAIVDVLYSVLDQAIAPHIKGGKVHTVRFCFASFYTFFFQKANDQAIPLDIAKKFFSSIMENRGQCLAENGILPCPLYKMHGKHAAKIVPEILGALGIFHITKHSTKEKTIQIDHEIIRRFGDHQLKDKIMRKLVDEASLKQWHIIYAEANFDRYNWSGLQLDRSQIYSLQYLPQHLFEAGMIDPAGELLSDNFFLTGRLSTFGLIEGTSMHLKDVETFSVKINSREECKNVVFTVCKAIQSFLLKKLDKDTNHSVHNSMMLEVGECIKQISTLLRKLGLLEDAALYCKRCVEAIFGGPPSDAMASLLFDVSLLYLDANMYDSAREIADLIVAMRSKLSGDNSILYARALSLLGDIAFNESDFLSANLHFNNCLTILKKSDKQCHLDLVVAHFKLGNTHYEQGDLEDALSCYALSLEFAKKEIPSDHEYYIHYYYQMGITLRENDASKSSFAFKQALMQSYNMANKSFDFDVRVSLIEGALNSINCESKEAIRKYNDALRVTRKYAPFNERMIAEIISLIGIELMNSNNDKDAIEMFCECFQLMKQSFGSMHLHVADILVTLSALENSNGKVSSKEVVKSFICLKWLTYKCIC